MLRLEQLAELVEKNRDAARATVAEFSIGSKQFNFNSSSNLINLTGSAGSEEIYRLVAEHDAAVIICYVQGANVREVGEFDFGRDPVELMYDYFARQIDLARRCGASRVLIDPGLGFYYRN